MNTQNRLKQTREEKSSKAKTQKNLDKRSSIGEKQNESSDKRTQKATSQKQPLHFVAATKTTKKNMEHRLRICCMSANKRCELEEKRKHIMQGEHVSFCVR